MKNKKTYSLRKWVERVLDGVCMLLVLLTPLFVYYALLESCFSGKDLRTIIKDHLDGY